LVFGLGIIGVALSMAGVFSFVLAAVGALITVAALVYQYRLGGAVVIPFTPEEWLPGTDGHCLLVPRRRHGKRAPLVTVWMPTDDGGHEEVICDVHSAPNGGIRICVGVTPFFGQLRIS
jgi:hypothetical protein